VFRLDELLAAKREEIRRLRECMPSGMPGGRRSNEPIRDFRAALAEDGLSVIAEMKRKSPSAGSLKVGLDPAEAAGAYEADGARAVSVLTDRLYFGGNPEDVRTARRACRLPVLRKEFLLDEVQIRQSLEGDADAVLLIGRILSPDRLERLHRAASSAGLACLVEVRNEKELDAAMRAGASIVGVNNRDLDTLEVDLDASLRMAPMIPDHVIKVSESGIRTAEDARRLREAGYDAILVGEAILRTPDLLREMVNVE
jgi:indole-3-glycerol phosphate synthase